MKTLLLTLSLVLITLGSLSAQEIPFEKEKPSRINFELLFGFGRRIPLDNSFYTLWRDVGVGHEPFEETDVRYNIEFSDDNLTALIGSKFFLT